MFLNDASIKRRGALMLFSGQTMSQKDFVQERPNAASLKRVLSERNKSELTTNNERQDSMIRTLNDLQRNIFLYGIEKVRLFKHKVLLPVQNC